jgi:CBS domain-containing protein
MSNAKLHLVDSAPAPRAAKGKAVPVRKTVKSPDKAEKRPTQAQDLMTAPIVCCRATDTLNTAAQLMWESDVGTVVVVNDQHMPTNVVTDRDLSMASYTQGLPLFSTTVATAMSKSIVSCSVETPVDELRQTMIEQQLRRIPVTDSGGRLVGIIGLADLLREASAPVRKGCKRGTSSAELQKLTGALYAPAKEA